jgi:hypothetical protein
MHRRKFLWLLIGGVLLSIVGFFIAKSFRKIVYNILAEDLEKLKIQEGSIEQYIIDAEKEYFWGYTRGQKEFIKAHYYFPFLPLPYAFKYRQFRANITGMYLLSTDFFLNKMDASKPVTYLSYYNPYKRPCTNPFSNLYYPV